MDGKAHHHHSYTRTPPQKHTPACNALSATTEEARSNNPAGWKIERLQRLFRRGRLSSEKERGKDSTKSGSLLPFSHLYSSPPLQYNIIPSPFHPSLDFQARREKRQESTSSSSPSQRRIRRGETGRREGGRKASDVRTVFCWRIEDDKGPSLSISLSLSLYRIKAEREGTQEEAVGGIIRISFLPCFHPVTFPCRKDALSSFFLSLSL